ncbi:MAG: EAL domain-containing protein [Acidimicrobiia bacterium]
MHFGNTRRRAGGALLEDPAPIDASRPVGSPAPAARAPRLQIPPFALFAVLAAMFAILPLGMPESDLARLLGGPGVALVATLAAVYGIRRWQPRPSAPWWWVAAGLTLFTLGEAASWAAQTLEIPWSALWVQVLAKAGYPVIAFGLLRVASAQAKTDDRSAILDALVVGAAAALNLWLVIGEQFLADTFYTSAEKVTMVLSLTGSALVVVLTVRLLFSLSTHLPSVVMLLGALSALLVGGFLWASNAVKGDPIRDAGTGLCFAAGYALLGLAACHESAGERVVVPDDRAVELRPHRLVLLIAAAIVPPALIIGESIGSSDARHGLPIAATAIVVSILVFVRMFGLTARVRELAERRGRDRFEAMVQHSHDIITVINAEGTIEYVSPAVREQWGYTPEECLGKQLQTLISLEDSEQGRRHLDIATNLAPSGTHEFEVRIGHRDGAMRDYEVVATNLSELSDITGTVLTLHDITDRKVLEAQLAHQAFHDSLTGLANRALFLDRVEHALLRQRRDNSDGVAVLFIDLDDFKSVNDGLGHGAGDDLLVAVGERLVRCLRPGDTAARLGGDEFAVLLDRPANLSSSQAVAERILEVLQLPITVGTLDITVPASIGIALAGPESTTQDLVRDADIAMYTAKSNGKGRVELFADGQRENATRRLELRSRLASALDHGELRLVFQPIVDLRSNRIVSAEALLRWHPTGGRVVAPMEFIPLAEESGLIVPIGRWVMENSVRTAKTWQRDGQEQVAVSVNVSGVQMRNDTEFVDFVRATLERFEMPASCLIVELTETVMMEDTNHTLKMLAQFRDLGVRISIDDFGTGFCSLSYLRRFAVDRVKIDRSFVEELGRLPTSATLASNILTLAGALGVGAVAEGVETSQQVEVLRSLSCESAQGYYFARPVDEAEIAAVIEGGRGLTEETTAPPTA